MFALLRSASLLAAGLALGCSSSALPPAAPAPSTAQAAVRTEPPAQSSAPADPDAVECKLSCGTARLVPRVAPDPDYTQREIDDATTVMASMSNDLRSCYRKRVRINPKAHAFITVDILVGSDGRVRNVDTTGGALLGDATMACIVHRIERGVFEPPHGGGTIHVQMPFSLRVTTEDDET